MIIQIGDCFPSSNAVVAYWCVSDIRGSMTRLVSADLRFESWQRTGTLERMADELQQAGYDVRKRERIDETDS